MIFYFVEYGYITKKALAPNIMGEHMLKDAREAINCYLGGKKLNSGRIFYDKCWCYMIKFKLKGRERSYNPMDESLIDNKIHIKKLKSLEIPIERINPSRAK